MAQISSKFQQELKTAVKHWRYVSPILTFPKNEKEYQSLVARLDKLLDIVGENEKHELMGLVDLLSNLIAIYEDNHLEVVKGRGIDALKFLMKAHGLYQADLQEIASQGVISEILAGKRKLNLRQIKLLAKRFKVEPETFLD
jgi:HTH-type transcriptional regulator/antitoxin HigA